jgi:hypothetical protein
LKNPMRWTLRISALLLVGWAIFMVSPFVALYGLMKAVEARDLARIEERVDVPAMRISLTRQLVTDYLVRVGRGKELEGIDRSAAAEVGATLADPLVAELVTPQALIGLLDERGVAAGASAALGGGRGLGDVVEQAFLLFVKSESRGFRSIVMPIPPGQAPDEGYRLHLRLSGATWRLTGIDLPRSLRLQLVRKLPRKI